MTNIELFEENKNIVYYCYNQLNKTDFIINSQDELIQEGFLAMWQAILTYDYNRCGKISSYIFPCVKNAMLSWIRDTTKVNMNTLSLNTVVSQNSTDSEEITLEDILYEEFPEITDVSIIDEVLDSYTKYVKKHHKSKSAIDRRIDRAKIILYELFNTGKIDGCKIQSKYKINRTIVGKITQEIREALQEEYPTRFENRRRHKNND